MAEFFNSKANNLVMIALEIAAVSFALWQMVVGGPYQDLAIILMVPVMVLGMGFSYVQLKKYF